MYLPKPECHKSPSLKKPVPSHREKVRNRTSYRGSALSFGVPCSKSCSETAGEYKHTYTYTHSLLFLSHLPAPSENGLGQEWTAAEVEI